MFRSRFKQFLDIIKSHIIKERPEESVVSYDGARSPHDRASVLQSHKNGEISILLVSIEAHGGCIDL